MLAAHFREMFAREPRLFRAPGRINIIGEHTDYTGGLVMPAAIDRWCNIAAALNGTRDLQVFATAYGEHATVELDEIQPEKRWIDYVAGVAAILEADGIRLPGCDMMIESDVPIGAGVSSSAALEVAVARALLALAGVEADGAQVARWAQGAENRFVGMPCGIMDQFASANGRKDSAMVLDCRSLAVRYAPMPGDGVFLVVNSMVKHALVDGEYRARRQDCEGAVERLGIASLRDIAEADLAHLLPELPARMAMRVRHVVTENARVQRAALALDEGDTSELGHLLNRSHSSLRDDMEVSIEMLDTLVRIAQKTPGVLGARMMGGGFGGSVLVLVRADAIDMACAAIVAEYGAGIGKAPDAFVCHAVDGAGEVTP